MYQDKQVIQHEGETEAAQVFNDQVNAALGGRWLGVIAFVDDEDVIHLMKTTWQFPKDKFLNVIALLSEAFTKETAAPLKVTPLSLGDFAALQQRLQSQSPLEPGTLPMTGPIKGSMRDDDPVHTSLDDEDNTPFVSQFDDGNLQGEELVDKIVADINEFLDEDAAGNEDFN